MNRHRCYKHLAVLALVLSLTPKTVSACSCTTRPELKSATADSSAIFIGRVEEATDSPFKPGKTEVTFKVLRSFKSPPTGFESNKRVIYTPKSPADCGFRFLKHQDYLVFATGNPAYYRTSTCTRSALMETAQEDIKYLSEYIATEEEKN